MRLRTISIPDPNSTWRVEPAICPGLNSYATHSLTAALPIRMAATFASDLGRNRRASDLAGGCLLDGRQTAREREVDIDHLGHFKDEDAWVLQTPLNVWDLEVRLGRER